MATQTEVKTGSEYSADTDQNVRQLQELFADAPEVGKRAVENVLPELTSGALQEPGSRMESAGRTGSRQGRVSELTLIIPFAPGGARRLRGLLKLLKGNFHEADKIGTVHDMRFVFLDNHTRLLFATAYDGDWDTYIDDFVTKVPDYLDMLFSAMEGWPGIRNPGVKDWIVKYQITAEGWYVANPSLTVLNARRLERVGLALDEFLDKIGG